MLQSDLAVNQPRHRERELRRQMAITEERHDDNGDDDFTVLPLGLRLLEFSGLWGDPRRKRSFILMLVSTILFLIVPKIVLGTGNDSFDSLARSTAEFIFCYNNYLMMAIFASRRELFEKLVRTFQAMFNQYRTYRNAASAQMVTVNRKIARYSRLYVWVQGVYFLIFNCLPLLVTYRAYFSHNATGNETNETTVTFLLPVESRFFFLDIRHRIVDYTIFSILACPAFLFTAYLTVVKGLIFIGIIAYNTLQYQLVSTGLRELRADDAPEQVPGRRSHTFRRRLIAIIDLHGTATECTKLLDRVLHLILLVQFTNTVLMCCLFLFYISKNMNSGAVNVLILFLALTVENFSFAFFGTRLTAENFAVGQEAYNTAWYQLPLSMQTHFQHMIRHAYRPRGITVGKFHFIDVASFGQLLKMIYSYYLILKELF
uniref:Uncharacterized protein n=1 Tax=Anopheles atroparvus TaxID=41427 RepID=A0A182IVQ7_ANOAO